MKEIDKITLSFYIICKCFTRTCHQTLSPQKIKTIDRTTITNIKVIMIINRHHYYNYNHNNIIVLILLLLYHLVQL